MIAGTAFGFSYLEGGLPEFGLLSGLISFVVGIALLYLPARRLRQALARSRQVGLVVADPAHSFHRRDLAAGGMRLPGRLGRSQPVRTRPSRRHRLTTARANWRALASSMTDPVPILQTLLRCRSVTPADAGALAALAAILEPHGFRLRASALQRSRHAGCREPVRPFRGLTAAFLLCRSQRCRAALGMRRGGGIRPLPARSPMAMFTAAAPAT